MSRAPSSEAIAGRPESSPGSKPSIRSSVGRSTLGEAEAAGTEAAAYAMAGLQGAKTTCMLVFGTAGYDQAKLLDGVRGVAPGVPVVGCSAEGVITREGSDEGAHCVGVMAIGGDGVNAEAFWVPGLKEDSFGAGRRLAEDLAATKAGPDGVLLLFPDGLTVNATALLDGVGAVEGFPFTVAGGTAGELMQMVQTYQYCGDIVASDSVAAVYLWGDFRAVTAVSHGCEAVGLTRTITKASGNTVHEIDGKPAFEVFCEYLGEETDDLHAIDIVHLCVGEPLDDGGDYGEYIIRTPLGMDKETGSMHFPAELPEGSQIQMTRRDPALIESAAAQAAKKMATEHGPGEPAAMFQFDCAGRGRIIFGEHTDQHAVEPMQRAFADDVPWLGFHTYGEIAPVGDKPRFHNYTAVLCALYPK